MIVLGPLIIIVIYAIEIYIWLLIASAVLSWLVHFGVINRHNQFVNTIGNFLWTITEPALRPLRRIIPMFGGIDISPIALILGLIFAKMVLANIYNELTQVL
ncbi:MAG: YggT family protein [Kiloniellales bacterium]